MAKKKGTFTKHTSRVGSRVGDRAKNFVSLARAGGYDQTQFARDVSATVMDVAEFWGGVFGMRGSPTAPLVDLKGTTNQWKTNCVSATVVVEDPVPDDAVFPVGGGPLKLVFFNDTGTTK